MGDTEDMKNNIQELAEKLGFTVNFDPDADLAKFERGKVMTFAEVQALPKGGNRLVRVP